MSAARATARAASPETTPKPNLESFWPVFTKSWVWASMPGVARTRIRGTSPSSAVERREALELVEAVDDDAADAGLAGHPELVGRLVVAVQHEAVGGHAGRERDVELAAGGHVEVHALLVGQPRHRQAQERLGGVGHPVTERGDGLAATGPEVRLVVHEQRGAEPGGELLEVAAPDAQAALAHRGRVGEQVEGQGLCHWGTLRVQRRHRHFVADLSGIAGTSLRSVTGAAGSHGLGRGHAEERQADGQADPRRLDQPEAGLGEVRRARLRSRSSRGRSRGTGRPARAPRW